MTKQANGERTIRAPLSAIITDPKVRAAFARAERDQGGPLATVIIDPLRPLPSLGAEERAQIETDIETLLDAAARLIFILDGTDGDCEDEGAEHDGREPDADFEPSLGWTLSGQRGGFDDREEECEDEGAQCEDEGACATACSVL